MQKSFPSLTAFFAVFFAALAFLSLLATPTFAGDMKVEAAIAVDVGDAAPANTKIDEATITGDKDDFEGAFSISKPNNGWPVGDYKVEIYNGDDLVSTTEFTITAADAE